MEETSTYEEIGPTVITSHGNADFDAIGAMLAAHKLYPGSKVVFPDSQGKNLKDLYLKSITQLFDTVSIKSVNLDEIKRLVLVDTRQPSRIGALSALVEKPGVVIHIYDHHPRVAGDIPADHDVYQRTGSTTTMLIRLLRKRKISLSPDEATVMSLGIYEDTGSFTFTSTTAADYSAAAFLLDRGADLNVIASMLKIEITPRQVTLLNEMIQSAVHHEVSGVDIMLTAVSSEKYVGEFSTLIHLMVRMENPNVIFAMARMGGKIFISARSRIDEVNVGEILRVLGGGGHAYAAAATVGDRTLAQTEQWLMDTLHEKIRPRRKACDLMSSPAIAIDRDLSCLAASGKLTRYNVNALLVTKKRGNKEELLGIINRQVIEKALFHELDQTPVAEFMTTEVESCGPSADLSEIQEKIIDFKQRLLPVTDGGRILGVVTRTDLLNLLVRHTKSRTLREIDPLKEAAGGRKRNIKSLLKERMGKEMLNLLREIGEEADALGFDCYVVGGFVRDLLLYKDNDDIDIVIEGDGIAFAKRFAKMRGARVYTYEKFGTAVITLPGGFKVDVASARMEYYQFPAALPVVEMSSIKLDLYRRDFTINTLAVRLNPGNFGLLIDFFSARKDLKDKAIRILHNLSFVEDPTRAFRAVKFEQRYGFAMGKLTAGLIKNAVKRGFFERLSGLRVLGELRQILEEENPAPAIKRLFDFNLMRVIHPNIKYDRDMTATLASVHKVLAWHDLLYVDPPLERWTIYFMALIQGSNRTTTDNICKRLNLPPKYHDHFTRQRFKAGSCLYRLERGLPEKNSELFNLLADFKPELILFMMAATRSEAVKRAISHYYTQLRGTDIAIMGRDLMAMGQKPGPRYRDALNAVLAAKLDGLVSSREEELAFARKYFEENPETGKKAT